MEYYPMGGQTVKPQAATYPATTLKNPLTASTVMQAVVAGAAHSLAAAWVYVREYRDARAAEELYKELARLSDSELARRGLDRPQLALLVKNRS
jgi:hypothetical protein